MKALLIAKNESFMLADIPAKHRGGVYEMANMSKRLMPSLRIWRKPKPIRVRTFEWRGQIVNKRHETLIDFFEEI